MTPPDVQEKSLLDRVKDFRASDDLTITRDGDCYILQGKTRSLEIPAGVVLFAVRSGEVADNLGALAGKRVRK